MASLVSDGASGIALNEWPDLILMNHKKQRYLDSPNVYGIFTYSYIYHKIQVNVGKYTIHGCNGRLQSSKI